MRLSDDEHKRIAAAAKAASAETGAHLAVTIVPVSDRYTLYPLVWGALLALAAAAVVALGWPMMPLREAFVIEAAVFVFASLALDWFPLRLKAVPRHIRHLRATQLAHRAFAARMHTDGYPRGCILLFVSLGERYAEVIGDHVAHARIGEGAWERIVATLIESARKGRIADGAIAAINECAARLSAAD